MTAMPRLFNHMPAPLAGFGINLSLNDLYDPERPWELLGDPRVFILEHVEGIIIGRHCDIMNGATLWGPVFIGDNVTVEPGAVIYGPAIIGDNCVIGTGTRIGVKNHFDAGCWIGDNVVVGHCSQIKRSILMAGARAPHYNYVGDSILGEDVNLGAGVKLSNFRNDGREISVDGLPTGLRKLGAVLGDRVKIGCNAVTNPGCVVGAGSQIYAGVSLPGGVYPERQLIKLRQQIEIVTLR